MTQLVQQGSQGLGPLLFYHLLVLPSCVEILLCDVKLLLFLNNGLLAV